MLRHLSAKPSLQSPISVFLCSPAELEKLQMLAQDPRPMNEKQTMLAQVKIAAALCWHCLSNALKH